MSYRRFALLGWALLTVASLALAAGFTTPGTAGAQTWNQQQFDNCIDRVDKSYMAGDITDSQHIDLYQQCCRLADGNWTPHPTNGNGTGTCGAPPAIAPPTATQTAQNAPDVPAGTPPTKPSKAPKTTFTLAPLVPAPVG